MKHLYKTIIAAALAAAIAPLANAGQTDATVPVGVTVAESCALSAPGSITFPVTSALATFDEVARVAVPVTVMCTTGTAWSLKADQAYYAMVGSMGVSVQDSSGNNINSSPITGTGNGDVAVGQAVTVYGKLQRPDNYGEGRILGAGGTVGSHTATVKLQLNW